MLYKRLVQRRILSIKRKTPEFRNAHLAQRLKIEPSYLSRFFTDPKVNFSEELLFQLLTELKMSPSQIEHILTLRELDRTAVPERKKYLEERLKIIRMQSLRQEVSHLKAELAELLSSLADKGL